jgi:Flp pilus assembly protein TadD
LLDLAGAAFWKLAFFFAVFVLAGARAVGWNRRAAFGLGFFLVTVFPVLGLAPMKLYLLEHRVYLPMVGIALAAAATLAYAAWRSRAALPAGFAVVAVLAILAWTRVPVFRDPVSFWTAGAANAPLSGYAHDELGYVLTQVGRDEDAVVAFRKALRIDPRLDSSRYKLALALERSGRRGEAIAEIEELLRQHPRSVDAWNVLGVLRKRSGDLGGARAALGHGIEIAPEDPALLANLANVHEGLGAHDEAVDTLRTLVRVEPGATAAWEQLGRELYNARRYGEAVDALRRALSLGTVDALVRVDLAYALLRSGKRDEAVAEARSALEKSGGSPEVARRLESVGLLEAARAKGS